MAFDKKLRTQFRLRILNDQYKKILNEFQQAANQWLDLAKQHCKKPEIGFAKPEKHPNHVMAELKRLNYERAYIEFKIQALERNIQIPVPEELHRRMRKAELAVKFQEEFPKEFKNFQVELKKKLGKQPYRPKNVAKKQTSDLSLDLPISLQSNDSTDRVPETPCMARRKEPALTTIIRSLHAHGVRRLTNKHGYFQPPTFTKEKVEQILGINISKNKFQQVKSRMNYHQKRRKLGKAKRSYNSRKGKTKGKIFPLYRESKNTMTHLYYFREKIIRL